MTVQDQELDVNVIEPKTAQLRSSLAEVWRYRSLLGHLAIQFTKMLYRNTLLGWGWLVLRPLIPALVTAFVFGRIAKVSSGGVPYLIFILAGMSLWNIFGNSMRILTRSMQFGRRFMKTMYFPRILIPLAACVFLALEFVIYNVLLSASLVYYFVQKQEIYFVLKPNLVLAPIFVLSLLLFTLGIGFVTSILNTQARDVRFSVPYFVNLVFFLTPIIYPLSLVPENLRFWVLLNPLAPLIEGYRWSLLGTGEFLPWNCLYGVLMCAIVFVLGIRFFLKLEAVLNDSI